MVRLETKSMIDPPNVESEERRLAELMNQRCTKDWRFEDDPEYQELMSRRIERYKRATNPARGDDSR
jgi:hypothetical protein